MYDPGQLYVDPILSGFAVGFKDPRLHGEALFPITRVNTQSGRYRVFDRSDWLIFPSRREPGTVANEVRGRKWSEDTFSTKEHSLQSPVHDEERQELNSLGGLANVAFGGALEVNPERDAVNLITRSLLFEHEKKAADTATNTANYPVGNTVTLAGTSQWDQDWSNGVNSASDPVTNIRTAILAIESAIGYPPNLLMIPRFGAPFVEAHPRIVDRFKSFRLTAPEAFEQLTGFTGQIVLTDAVYNAADNLDATPVITSFWGKNVILAYVDPNDGMDVQTFAKTFAQVYPAGDIRPTDSWREENRKADLFRTSYKYDLKIVSSAAGYLIKNAFSSSAWTP